MFMNDELLINGRKAILGPVEPYDQHNPDHNDPNKYVLTPGDVFEHTIRVMEGMVEIGNKDDDVLMWSALLHDVGKPVVSTVENGVIRSKGHSKAGAEIVEEILTRLKFSNDFIEAVREIVYAHMIPFDVDRMKKSTLRKFLARKDIDQLIAIGIADCMGTEGNSDFILEWKGFIDKKREEFRQLELLPKPFISGRDLIELGMSPGPAFKKILGEVFDKQLEGELLNKEDAIHYVKSNY
jgi:putative nucleotidyltransferase with HDIG domain